MNKKLSHACLIGLGSAVLALLLWSTGALQAWENASWMMRVRHMAKPTPSTSKIKLILVDQPSLDWAKNEPDKGWAWPWPREVLATVLDFCHRGGAKAVAFDVMYTEPSLYGVGDDKAFSEGIKRGSPFVAAVIAAGKDREFKAWPKTPTPQQPSIQGMDAWMTQNSHFQGEKSATFPIPEVMGSAALLGNVSSLPDKDGIYRRNSLFRLLDGQVLPSLGLANYLAGNHQPHMALSKGWLHVGPAKAPIDERGQAILRFVGPSGTHQAFNVASVFRSEALIQEGKAPEIDPAIFKDCYVFFGYSAPSLFDLVPTPIGQKYPGVEVHATMLDNLLEHSFLRRTPTAVDIFTVLGLCLMAAIATLLSRKVWQTTLGMAIFLALPFALGYAAYAKGFWWPVMAGEVGVGLSMVGAVVVNYATEGRQKAFLKNAFRYYLGAEVIDQIIADPSKLSLGGEKREMSIFFSDIEKFSSFSERLEPAVLTGLLNDYLSDMGQIIQEEGGYLDKYIGDAIVAFWNAPLSQEDHATRACRTAVRCARKLDERRPEYEKRTGAVVKARIGLNTGIVTVGNMGSYQRFNYTILGDAANLASRLEGANKAFGTYSMVSESTWEAAGGQFTGRELGKLKVVGRKQPVKVYELTGLPGEARPMHFAAFEEALALFYEGKFQEAAQRFDQMPEDQASRLYATQCRELALNPPVDWDGVLSLTEK